MIDQTVITTKSELISYSQLPLAVYREIAAHLGQIGGIKVDLFWQNSREFNYNQSQIGSLSITYNSDLDTDSLSKIREILDYYAKKFGSYIVSG